MDYETLVANLLGSKPYRQTVGGREFLIVPLSMLVPGVLNGSQGPLYYSEEETKASAPLWDGMPITLYHPTGTDGASLLSVRNKKGILDPVIWDRQGIGYVRNSRFENGKLRAEGWFDVARVRQLDEHFSKTRYGYVPVLPRLESGEPVELSTGLFTANRRVKNGYDYKTNRPYIAEAHSYRPDHLAILPDVRGACSIEDGCGVHVANTFCPTGQGGGVDPTCSPNDVSHKAHSASVHSKIASKHYVEAMKARDAASFGNHEEAARLHSEVAEAHEEAANKALTSKAPAPSSPKRGKLQRFFDKAFGRHPKTPVYKTSEDFEAENHREAAALHRQAAEMYRSKSHRESRYRNLSMAYDSLAMNSLTHNHACCPSCIAGKPCEDEENERLGRDALRQKVEEGHNPPNWAVNEAKWEKAKARAKAQGHEEDWAYVVAIYKKMGGTIKGKPVKNSLRRLLANVFCSTGEGGGVDPSCSPRRSKSSTSSFDKLSSDAGVASHRAYKEGTQQAHKEAVEAHKMAEAKAPAGSMMAVHHERMARAHKHHSLEIGKHGGRVISTIEGVKHLNRKDSPFGFPGKSTHNQETQMKLTANQRTGIVQFLCNSEPWKSKQGSQVFLSQLDDETLQSLGAQAKGVQEAQRLVGNKGKQTQVVDDDDDDDEDEEEIASSGSVRNQLTEEELDEFSKQMFGQPASIVRQIVGNANKINQREKKQLIGRLVVNLHGEARERMAKRLAKKDAEELRDMLAMLQPTHNSFLDQPEDDLGLLARSFGVQGGGVGAGEETTLNFAGAGAGGGQTFKDDADNVLPWGTVSFNDLASPALRKTS